MVIFFSGFTDWASQFKEEKKIEMSDYIAYINKTASNKRKYNNDDKSADEKDKKGEITAKKQKTKPTDKKQSFESLLNKRENIKDSTDSQQQVLAEVTEAENTENVIAKGETSNVSTIKDGEGSIMQLKSMANENSQPCPSTNKNADNAILKQLTSAEVPGNSNENNLQFIHQEEREQPPHAYPQQQMQLPTSSDYQNYSQQTYFQHPSSTFSGYYQGHPQSFNSNEAYSQYSQYPQYPAYHYPAYQYQPNSVYHKEYSPFRSTSVSHGGTSQTPWNQQYYDRPQATSTPVSLSCETNVQSHGESITASVTSELTTEAGTSITEL